MIKKITLLLPDFLPKTNNLIPPDCPSVTKLLSRATRQTMPLLGFEALLQSCFNVSDHTLPAAALSALAKGCIQQGDTASYCYIDFVHLLANHHTVILNGLLTETLTAEENKAIEAILTPLLGEHFSCVSQDAPFLWQNKTTFDSISNPIWEVIGKSLRCRMPSGPDALQLQKLMTEVQMALKTAPFNQQRLNRHMPTVDGIWFWGEGALPQSVTTTYDCVVAEDLFVQGLAELSNLSYYPLKTFDLSTMENWHNLLIIDRGCQFAMSYHDHEAWQQHFKQFEQRYFAPLLTLLTQNACQQVTILTTGGVQFSLSPRQLHYFWRRIKKIESFVEHSS